MLTFEMHYRKHGKQAFKYIYAYNREDALRQARQYKTFTELHLIGYR